MNTLGSRFKLTLFGESHGPAIGVVIDGVPAGTRFDLDAVRAALRRRRPGTSKLVSARREPDEPEVLSGVLGKRTTGAPIAIVIRNRDARSDDYRDLRNVLRPGHADLAAWLRYGQWRDWRGGGHFSGRMTAPLVAAGAVAMMTPWLRGVAIAAHTVRIGSVGLEDHAPACCKWHATSDDSLPGRTDRADDSAWRSPPGSNRRWLDEREIMRVQRLAHRSAIGCVDKRAEKTMRAEIEAAASEGDSVGGIIECLAGGIPGGLGAPIFGSVEGLFSALLFSVPAVKGVEFGSGFSSTWMRGSTHNDPIVCSPDRATITPLQASGFGVADSCPQSQIRNPKSEVRNQRSAIQNPKSKIQNRLVTLTNNAGGVLGGMTTAMPIVFRVAIKPTPSIRLPQRTVALGHDAARGEASSTRGPLARPTVLRLAGRHDPCIVPRALPVVEACAAIGIANLE
ncbi:MAG: chorismate synthase [Planctomycetota bacterium]|nr:chorismate synthase [Planctomycetota bacterium]